MKRNGRGVSFGALLFSLAFALAAGCGRGERVAGPGDIGPSPVEFAFGAPVTPPTNEFSFCFEFDRPRDSADAMGLEIVLVTSEGKREPFHAEADRVGERNVCWRGKSTSTPPATYRAMEVTSAFPARVREIRFVPGQ